MSKPVLYTFGGSVWGAAAELAAAELYPEGAVELKTVNLVHGENFHPSFVKLNPNATIPTLEAEGEVYKSTADVISYLVKHAPKAVKPGSSVIQVVHDDKYDPNFSLLLARSDEELRAKGAAIASAFLQGRQTALLKHSATPEASPHKAFYDAKLEANGGLHAIYEGKVPEEVKNGFFKQSESHYATVAAFFDETLPRYIPASGFIGGEIPGEDDFHVGAWLARIAACVGAKRSEEGLAAFENAFGKPVPTGLVAYWNAWSARLSWQKVYALGLH